MVAIMMVITVAVLALMVSVDVMIVMANLVLMHLLPKHVEFYYKSMISPPPKRTHRTQTRRPCTKLFIRLNQRAQVIQTCEYETILEQLQLDACTVRGSSVNDAYCCVRSLRHPARRGLHAFQLANAVCSPFASQVPAGCRPPGAQRLAIPVEGGASQVVTHCNVGQHVKALQPMPAQLRCKNPKRVAGSLSRGKAKRTRFDCRSGCRAGRSAAGKL